MINRRNFRIIFHNENVVIVNVMYVVRNCNENKGYLPGPFAPPDNNRPKRNITARSYSCTTYNRFNLFFKIKKKITNNKT